MSQMDTALGAGPDSFPNVSPDGIKHGSAVSGIIAAEKNGFEGQGVAWKSKLILGSSKEYLLCQGCEITETSQIDSIVSLLDELVVMVPNQETIAVVNNSWGLDPGQNVGIAINDIGGKITTLATPGLGAGRNGKGLPFIFAAGNNARPVARGNTLLAALESVVAVSNINKQGLRQVSAPHSDFSNYGPWIDISAPGDQVFTTAPCTGNNCDHIGPCSMKDTNDEMVEFGGTSAASPVVAGALTLMHQENQGLEGPQYERILRHTARKINFTDRFAYSPVRGFSDSYGFGLVDAESAVLATQLTNDGLSWPEPPTNISITQVGSDWQVTWTNPTAPVFNQQTGALEDPNGEFSEAIVVRYDGNVWDQKAWPRSVTPAATGVADTSNELLWTPPDGTAIDQLAPPTGVIVFNAFQSSSFTDTTIADEAAATYAVFAVNAVNNYSVPAIILKQSRNAVTIAPSLVTHDAQAQLVTFNDTQNFHHLPYTISADLGLAITQDADGDDFTQQAGEFWSLYGALTSTIMDGETWLEMDFDLTEYTNASLTFAEIVEVWGFSGSTPGAIQLNEQACSLSLTEINGIGGNPVQNGIVRLALVDHTSISFNQDTRNYDWRKQEINLDDFMGKFVRVRWKINKSFESPAMYVIGGPSDIIGWWIDQIEVRGDPVLPLCSDADFNNDGVVDGVDLATLLTNWGACPPPCPTDLNGDGVVGCIDMAMLLGVWGACGQPAMEGPGSAGPSFNDDEVFGNDPGQGYANEATGDTLPWIIEDLGFDSVLSYMYWVSELNENELSAHIAEVLQMILNHG